MYGQQTLQDITFHILYGGVAVFALMAAFYLLLRRANAIEPTVDPPLALRRWTVAFLAAAAASHVWWFVLGCYWMTDDRLVRNITAILLDHATLVPLVMAVLLAMLQDRSRPLWPWLMVQIPMVIAAVAGIVWHDWFWGYKVSHYCQLAVIIAFVVYYLFQLRQYDRWLRDNYADLEHKEVWRSLVFAVILFVVYEMYTSNSGDTVREYLSQMLTVAIVVLLVWRVETLQRLERQPQPLALQGKATDRCDSGCFSSAGLQGESGGGSEALSNISDLLKEKCEKTGLYLMNDLTLVQLSAAVGVNRTYLSRYFSSQGMNYNTYINGLRINHFVSLYQKAVASQQSFTAQQLAQECGYRSYSTFSLAFKQRTGQSVTAWIRDLESEE